jgi:kinesin family protein C2/C3
LRFFTTSHTNRSYPPNFAEEKLAESTAANAALSAQLENISPQLASLEQALTESRTKLREEQKLRRAAENAQDEADQRVRELEQSLQQAREECDDVHEELAFRENELEEMKLELEVEKQQMMNELAAARSSAPTEVVTEAADEGYTKKLEEELELVTEQLIDMEKRLSEAEADVANKQAQLERLQTEGRREEDEDLIRTLQTENADRLETEERLRNEISVLKEELALSKEEVALQQEELHAAEEDYKATTMALEEERMKHKEEVTRLGMRIKEAEMATTSTLGEAAMVATTVQSANEENAQLKDELISLEAALANAKKDYETVMEELEAVNARFDEAREEARREGEEMARENLRNEQKSDSSHELQEARAQLDKLIQENKLLQEKVDAAEVALAAASDREGGDAAGGSSEVVKQLQAQLARSKDELVRKNKEISELSEMTEQRLSKAEENVVQLESQLRATKASLAEAEARIIVLKREKERAENVIPPQSPRRAKEVIEGGPSPPTLSAARSRSRSPSAPVREELEDMEDAPTPSKGRHRARSSSPSSVMRLEFQLAEQKTKYAELEKAHNELLDQKRMSEVRLKRMEEDLRFLRKQVFEKDGATVTQMTRLSSLASSQKDTGLGDDNEMGRVNEIIESRDVKAMAAELINLEKKCNSQRLYNAELLSKMLHLQGNIQVYCRVRPMSLAEIEKGYKSAVEALSENEVGCFDSRTNKWKSFAFDRVWGPDQSQQSVFQDVEPLALSVVDGFNACIFA